MLATKNSDIGKAYDILTIMSKNESARMAYEAREAEIHDQATREMTAREEGREEGIEIGVSKGENKKAIRVAEKMLRRGDLITDIVEITELTEEKVLEIKNKIQN